MTSFALRLPDHLMEQAKAASAEDKVSINQMLVSFIAEGLGHRRGLKMMKERAARADIDAALAILDSVVPDVPPEAGDELPADDTPSGTASMSG
ncbi:MAG TPA: hypothetical protein VEH76_00720 [Methylocystis sp.]|nr:hypothetical protein [Methylocystis sp.]